MALIVQDSTGLYRATQYDGTNADELVTALQALNPSTSGGVLAFTAAWARGAQQLQGHRFNVPTTYWVVWADLPIPYVVAVVSAADFPLLYTVACDCAAIEADMTSLQAAVAALVGQVNALTPQVAANTAGITVLEAQTADLFANYVGRLAAGVVVFSPIGAGLSDTLSVVPNGTMIDNDFSRQAFLASIGDTSLLADLEITAINAVDDATTEVQVTNNGAVPSPGFAVVVLHIHN